MESPGVPLLRVECDSEGTATVYTTEKHLLNFPRFIHFVIENKIGFEKGFFKIIIVGIVEHTKLDDLCQFIQSYLSDMVPPKTTEEAEAMGKAFPTQQKFFFGSHAEDLYGLQHTICSNSQYKTFLSKVSIPDSFNAPSSCCAQALEKSVSQLEAHYWEVVRSVAQKSSALGPSVTKAEMQEIRNEAELIRPKYFLEDTQRDAEVQWPRHPPKSVPKRNKTDTVLYCPGIPLENVEFRITENFSLSDLRTILDIHPEIIPGLSYPYLYVAARHASFAWHVEDQCLFSINYLHFGAPCVWFFVAPQDYKKFSEVVKFFPLDPGHVSCSFVLIHKYLVASKNLLQKYGIPVHTVIQRKNEIVVTYPFAAHAGFKLGFNISQAANFADPWWVQPGIFVPPCVCLPNQVNMDLRKIVSVVCPELLEMYVARDFLGLAEAVKGNEFLKLLQILPPTAACSTKETMQSKPSHDSVGELQVEKDEEVQCSSQEKNMDSVEMPSFKGARYLLQCPAGCGKTLAGGRARLSRMMKHVKDKHPDRPELVDNVKQQNPPKTLRSQYLVCPICGEKRAGKKFHLDQHMRKKHSQKQTLK